MRDRTCVLCVQRLKFTVVSEPMDEDEECVDVGHAFLDLKELLLTGNDVTEQQIDSRCTLTHVNVIQSLFVSSDLSEMKVNVKVNVKTFLSVVSLDEDKEVIGNLKVSLEAAKALTGIYQEFHQKSDSQGEEDTSEDEEDEEEKRRREIMQLIDYDDDSDL